MLGATGLDSSLTALRDTRRRGATAILGDALRMPFGRVFNTIVSFETIEHLPDAERFVAECTRVLTPGGLLIISTPNRALWSPRSPKPLQKHHVREFNLKEFLAVLKPFQVELYGQLLMDRGGSAFFEGKELAKRVLRAFLPVRRFRRPVQKRLGELIPDPRYNVEPCGSWTPAIFVAIGRLLT
jgi:SAM-dependent methyltransferase